MSKKFNFVYKTTNLLTGKEYIGSHSTNKKEDGYLGSGRHLLKVIKKYGRKNFKREILEECKIIEEARKLEEKYIIIFHTIFPNGYNFAPKGGLGFNGAEISELTKEKIKNKQKGKSKLLYYIEKYGDIEDLNKYNEWKNILAQKSRGRIKSNEEMEKIRKTSTGRPCSDERKRKIGKANSIALKGKKQSQETIYKRLKTRPPWNKGQKQAWIHKDGVTKIILYSELEKYLLLGWVKGRGKLK